MKTKNDEILFYTKRLKNEELLNLKGGTSVLPVLVCKRDESNGGNCTMEIEYCNDLATHEACDNNCPGWWSAICVGGWV